jgi:hypothetical protein
MQHRGNLWTGSSGSRAQFRRNSMRIFEKQRGISTTKPAAQSAPQQTNSPSADRRRGFDWDSGIAISRRPLTTRKMQVHLMPTASKRATVLSIGDDPRLLETREMVLASAGYAVLSASSEDPLDKELIEQIDIAVVCQSVPTKRASRVAEAIRMLRLDLPILHLGVFRACLQSTYERTLIDFPPRPEVLLKTLEQMLPRSTQSR